MTDRELLEAAAKAAYKISPEFAESRSWWNGFLSSWNPLEDDDDALRLAVKLGFIIDTCEPLSVVTDYSGELVRIEQDHGTDPYAATRRAIVRAAAEIGRGMP